MFRANKAITLLGFAIVTIGFAKPEISIVRYNDNNKALRADTADLLIHRKIKHIPLSRTRDDVNLSFGGEIREQFYVVRNSNFGDGKPGSLKDETYLEQRYLLHSDLQLSKRIRTFVQVTSNHIAGEKNIHPSIDENDLDISQLFGDFVLNIGQSKLLFRLGRQEVSYGSRRMIGFREGPSVRRSFEGGKLSWGSRMQSVDIFYLLPVKVLDGLFDDYSSGSSQVLGIYLKKRLETGFHIEGYYIGAIRDSATYVDNSADEVRHSLGARGFYRSRSTSLSLESTYQFGKFGSEDISAFQIAFQGWHCFNRLTLKPTLSLWADLFSGDMEKGDGKNNTFRAISASPVGETPFSIGNANLISIRPTVSLDLFNDISLSAMVNPLWRFSENDYLYVGSITRVKRKHRKESDALYYATSFSGEIAYKPGKHIKLVSRVGVAIPKEYAEVTGKGETMKFGVVAIQYKF